FRGALQSWLGWLPAAILFALAHWAPPRHFRWWTLWALAGGLGLGWVTAGRGGLGAAITAHLTVNSWQLVRFALHTRRARPGVAPTEAAPSDAALPEAASPEAAPGPELPDGAASAQGAEPGPVPAAPTDEVPEEALAELSKDE